MASNMMIDAIPVMPVMIQPSQTVQPPNTFQNPAITVHTQNIVVSLETLCGNINRKCICLNIEQS